VTQAQIDEMMITNPRRFLTGEDVPSDSLGSAASVAGLGQ
jgi:hypothetical protein